MQTKTLDVSSEEERQYVYGNGGTFTVPTPVELHIIEDAKGVSHRVISADGRTYRPERGWTGIVWLPKSGQPAFIA